jgi:SET domain-containing protein
MIVGSSEIQGSGLFAAEPIREGEVVAIIGGQLVTDGELARMRSHSSTAIGDGRNLLQAPDDPLRFGNHSCDPNLWLLDAVTLAARRDIARGEELTTDYATHTGMAEWLMPCSCGTPLCRGVVRGTDWHDPELQRRYRGHFSPFLNQRIAARADSN